MGAEMPELFGRWEWNLRNNAIICSTQYATMLGYTPEELAFDKERWCSLIHPEDLPLVEVRLEMALQKGGGFYSCYRQRSREGEWHWLFSSGDVVHNGEGVVERLVVSSTNVTLLRRMGEQFALTHQKLRQQEFLMIQQTKMARMGEMIGAIAHQWKQPLNVIALMVSGLEAPDGADESYKEELRLVRAEVERQVRYMAQSISDFRGYFRPSRTKESIDVRVCIEQTLRIMEFSLHQLGIAVHIKGESFLGLFGYANELKQVLMNLISNAKDAIEQAGVLNGTITIELEDKGDKGVIIMTDNGGGIPEELLPERLFEPHVSSKGEKGTGIGLSLARLMIAEHFGGEIHATNVDSGARFEILLPLEHPQETHKSIL